LGSLDGFFDFNAPPAKFTPIKNQGFRSCDNYSSSSKHLPPNAAQSRWLRMVGNDGDDD
jgi:hypothetical protein